MMTKRHIEKFNLLVELELSLHTSVVRGSSNKLESLLSDDFMEIGASGRMRGKDQTIRDLLTEDSSDIRANDFELRTLSNDVAQLIYKSDDGRHAIRNSIWKVKNNQWRMIFHQATLTGKNSSANTI